MNPAVPGGYPGVSEGVSGGYRVSRYLGSMVGNPGGYLGSVWGLSRTYPGGIRGYSGRVRGYLVGIRCYLVASRAVQGLPVGGSKESLGFSGGSRRYPRAIPIHTTPVSPWGSWSMLVVSLCFGPCVVAWFFFWLVVVCRWCFPDPFRLGRECSRVPSLPWLLPRWVLRYPLPSHPVWPSGCSSRRRFGCRRWFVVVAPGLMPAAWDWSYFLK